MCEVTFDTSNDAKLDLEIANRQTLVTHEDVSELHSTGASGLSKLNVSIFTGYTTPCMYAPQIALSIGNDLKSACGGLLPGCIFHG